MRVVVDTNVIVSALRSKRGASFQILLRLGLGEFQPLISPPMCFEYEDVLNRTGVLQGFAKTEIDDFLDYFLSQSQECRIHFLWRPHLPDPQDDMVLELAFSGEADLIVTHNIRDFRGSEELGIRAVTPGEFLAILDSV